METTEIAVQNKPETVQGAVQGVTLTEEVALAIRNSILSGERYYDRQAKLIRLRIPKEGGEIAEVVFSASTYDSWINREAIVPNTQRSLKEIVETARAKYLEIKEKKEDQERIRLSERALTELLSLPIYDTSVMRELKRDENGKMRETKRTTIKQVSAPLVNAKVKGLQFTLERLNPAKYGKKEEVKHAHVIFSLADLRKHREANRQSQQ